MEERYKINLHNFRMTHLQSLIDNIYDSAAIVVNDMIYIIGRKDRDPSGTINRYSIKDDVWITKGDHPICAFKPVLLYHENNIYICSTDCDEVYITRYNPEENESYACRSKKCGAKHLSPFIEGNRICIITTDKTFYFDFIKKLWEERENFLIGVNDCVSF